MWSNLGGFENTTVPPTIMYVDVGTNPATGRSIGISVSNTSEYSPFQLSNNGLHSDLGRINLGVPVDADDDGVVDNGLNFSLVELVFSVRCHPRRPDRNPNPNPNPKPNRNPNPNPGGRFGATV